MSAADDRTAFLARNPVRLQIAEWCEEKPHTREELARRLDRPPGGLSAPATMLRHGALVEAGTTPPAANGRRSTRLVLAPNWRPALREARRGQIRSALERGSDLLLIKLPETEAACHALAAGLPDIEWGADLAGEQLGLLLVPHRDPRGATAIRAAQALRRAGAEALRLRINSPMGAADLERWAGEVLASDQLQSGE